MKDNKELTPGANKELSLEERVAQLEEHELVLIRLVRQLEEKLKMKQNRKDYRY